MLLGLLLFNWCGYRWVINIMQERADTALEARLDKNDYDESALTEIRIPVSMPYQTDWANFERFDGEIEINGVNYKYVKRKIAHGELVLKCIPNREKQQLESAKSDFLRIINDTSQDNGQKSSNVPGARLEKNPLSYYLSLQQKNNCNISFIVLAPSYNLYQHQLMNYLHCAKPGQPPKV